MSHEIITLLVAAWHSLVIYLLLIVGLRFIGRALMAQFNLLEYLSIALLGSAVESGLYAGSGTLLAGLVSVSALLLADRLLSLLLDRFRRLRRLLVGSPIVLVHDGQLIKPHLRHAGLTVKDVQAAIRERGYEQISDVRYAVLELNGSVGVIPFEQGGRSGAGSAG